MGVILGFNAYIHDTAAALLIDGRLAAYCEQERLDRIKHTTAFPAQSIDFVLQQAGLSMDDVEDVSFYWDPMCGFGKRAWQTIRSFPGSLRQLFDMQLSNFSKLRNVESFFRTKYNYRGRFHYVNHYLSHAAGAFYPSGFEDANILIADGNGEIATTWFGVGENTKITKIGEVYYPHSLGLLYCTVTEYLGFRQNSDEGKVMGLSAYGSNRFVQEFRKIVRVEPDGQIKTDLSYFDYHTSRKNWFSPKFAAIFGPARKAGEEIEDRHKDVAFACQRICEESIMEIVEILIRKTGKRRLVFSGGMALNCVLNGKLITEGVIDDLYVPPPAYDAGASWGCALHVFHNRKPKAERDLKPSVFMGPEFNAAQIESSLKNSGVAYEKPLDIIAATAGHIAAGKIVARFDGRMEMGPRALGHRSILADPSSEGMKDQLNTRVKHRESFRPFGPSVLAERAAELFNTKGRRSPYMLETYQINESWRKRLPAITHIDGTARIQTVNQTDDPAYYAVIKAFDELTEIPCVLNTSFNVMGQPIVNTPDEAVECFLSTDIDVLAIGPFIVVKE